MLVAAALRYVHVSWNDDDGRFVDRDRMHPVLNRDRGHDVGRHHLVRLHHRGVGRHDLHLPGSVE